MKVCAVPVCDRAARARGWCAAHYMQWQKGLTPSGPVKVYAHSQSLDVCSVGGCSESGHARGWCRNHYTRWLRTGSVELISRPDCLVDGCDKRGGYTGHCSFHARRARQGIPLNAPRYNMPNGPCVVDGCDRQAETKRGWCRAHYNRWRRTGEVGQGDIREWVAIDPAATCSVDGCDSPVVSREWCNRHYKQWLNRKPFVSTPRPVVTVNLGRSCSVEDCPRWARSRGLCQAHYHQQRRQLRRLSAPA